MHWATLYPALLSLFGELATEDPSFEAEDRDRPRQIMSPVHKMTLAVRVLSLVGLGEDEERLEFVDGRLQANITGQRKLVLQLEVDSIENTDTGWAWAAIERVRTRLRRQSSLDALHAVDAALIRVGPALQANFRHEGRMHSRVLLDVELGVCVNDLDTSYPGNWIEKVVITSHAQGVIGDELPSPPNVTDHLIDSSGD